MPLSSLSLPMSPQVRLLGHASRVCCVVSWATLCSVLGYALLRGSKRTGLLSQWSLPTTLLMSSETLDEGSGPCPSGMQSDASSCLS